MFLATTALDEFWDKEQELLFLGSWCIRGDRHREVGGLRHRVMPSPWDDRKRFEEAAQYLDRCAERMLGSLADYLNAVHHKSFSRRYWQILIGPWLFHGLHILYDRYIHLQEALTRDPRLQTLALDPQWFRIPRDTEQFVHWACDDPFNLQLFSQLLKGMGLSFPTRGFRDGWPNGDRKESIGGEPALFKKILRRVLERRCRTLLCDLYLPRGVDWVVAWRTGLKALPVQMESNGAGADPTIQPSRQRSGLAGLPFSGEFERIFVKTLPLLFPAQYLEAYRATRDAILQRYPRNPEAVVSAVGWYFNEPFKFLAAETAAQGGRLIAAQHGGGYGLYRRNPFEQHEAQVSDSYGVWGWADPGTGSLKNLPAPRLSSLPHRLRKRAFSKASAVLFIASENPRYFCRFYSTPQGTQWDDYLEWQLRFLEHLSPGVRSVLWFRPHRHDFGRPSRRHLSDRFPGLQWDGNGPLQRSLENCQLAVVDHLGTALLEVLVANLPTVLFWDRQRWEVRPEAEPYLDQLRRVGILTDSPEEAAARVSSLYCDPRPWWESPPVQEARQRFVSRYALTDRRWLDRWAEFLRTEISRGSQWREGWLTS